MSDERLMQECGTEVKRSAVIWNGMVEKVLGAKCLTLAFISYGPGRRIEQIRVFS